VAGCDMSELEIYPDFSANFNNFPQALLFSPNRTSPVLFTGALTLENLVDFVETHIPGIKTNSLKFGMEHLRYIENVNMGLEPTWQSSQFDNNLHSHAKIREVEGSNSRNKKPS